MNTLIQRLPLIPKIAAALSRPPGVVLADRVILALLAGVAVLAMLDPAKATGGVIFSVQSLLGILPYLLLAIGLAAFLRASGADRLVARAFSGRSTRSIVVASLAGALSPFCSCGVVAQGRGRGRKPAQGVNRKARHEAHGNSRPGPGNGELEVDAGGRENEHFRIHHRRGDPE